MAERLHELFDLIGPLASRANASPVCWIGGDDDGGDYCWSCCRALVKHHNRKVRGRDNKWSVDGGWPDRRESDGNRACSSCGTLLQYWLTRYGVEEELYHFENNPINAQLSPVMAYEIEAVLLAAEGTEAETRAIAVAEKCLPFLPQEAK